MKNLKLTRPLVFIDLETTGTKPEEDRIVEFYFKQIIHDGTQSDPMHVMHRFVNPGVPISPEATAVHGITNEQAKLFESFKSLSPAANSFLKGCDLAGFGIKRFDLKVLVAEFRRCNIEFKLSGRRIIDAMEIFHQKERRDLKAAVHFYLGANLVNAHRADVDVNATIDVLDEQISRYGLPMDVDLLEWETHKKGELDIAGNFLSKNGEIVFTFGKHQGKKITEVDHGYLIWFQKQSFFDDAKEIVRAELFRREHSQQPIFKGENF